MFRFFARCSTRYRLKAVREVIAALLARGRVLDALRLLPCHSDVFEQDGLRPRDFLRAVCAADDEQEAQARIYFHLTPCSAKTDLTCLFSVDAFLRAVSSLQAAREGRVYSSSGVFFSVFQYFQVRIFLVCVCSSLACVP